MHPFTRLFPSAGRNGSPRPHDPADHPALDAGGAERTAVDIAAGLAEAGARALVATEGGRLVAELQAKGGVWLPLPGGDEEPVELALNILR